MNKTASFTEENYLKIIHGLSGDEKVEVSTNELAERTATRAASVTDMLKKLSEKGLINYRKYQGVTLTEAGTASALTIIRKHRLWEVFLVEKLGFGWDEVHDIAEELEHIPSDRLVERLDAFLGFPKFDPHGDPIPDSKGRMPDADFVRLSDAEEQMSAQVAGVSDHSPAFLRHLDKVGLNLGSELFVKTVNEYDKSLLLIVGSAEPCFVSHEAAQNILVQLLPR